MNKNKNEIALISPIENKIGDEVVETINARNLHEFLGSKRDFSNWINYRIKQYGFVENEDYLLNKFVEQVSSGTKYKNEYFVTIDMAKELSMVENNEKGKKARKYFIECEKKLLKQLRSKKINRNDPVWLEARANTIPVRKDFTAMLKPIVDLAVAEKGKGIEQRIYSSYTDMLYKSFLILEKGEKTRGMRDRLNTIQLTHLATLETIARKVIDECINALTPWRDIYHILKEKALLFGSMIDRTRPGFNVKQLSVGVNHGQEKITYAPAFKSNMVFSKQ